MRRNSINRRRFPRADYPCKVVVLRSDLKHVFSTHTENIGAGGICVVLSKALPQSCPVEILLYLKDGGVPIECNGRIAWALRRGGNFDTGIEFIDIQEPDRSRIENVVQECLRESI